MSKNNNKLVTTLCTALKLKKEYIENILALLDDGATIPFIARYRKERTGGASDELLREFETIYQTTQKLLQRKEEVSRLIAQRATLSDDIKLAIENASLLRVLYSWRSN